MSEEVEVVAHRNALTHVVAGYGPTVMDWDDEQEPVEPLMTVIQHQRIVEQMQSELNEKRQTIMRLLIEMDALKAGRHVCLTDEGKS